MGQITQLLSGINDGDKAARDALFELAYAELKKLAHVRLYQGGRSNVLDTTALVHEAYIRFIQSSELRSEDRRSFFAFASQVMRNVIVDTARSRLAQRRGGGNAELTLSTQLLDHLTSGEQAILEVHEALLVLEQADPRLARLVEMRYYGGYSETEIAEALGVTERTVQRDWSKARLLLKAALQRS
jgi:RNA polymerase sigma factor (TIGR02999 family)